MAGLASDLDLGEMVDHLKLKPKELRDLYFELDITRTQIAKWEKDAGPDADGSSKAKTVLELWRKEAGENATRQIILEALERCENLEAKKSLEDLWKPKEEHRKETTAGLVSVSDLHEMIGLLKLKTKQFRDLYFELDITRTQIAKWEKDAGPDADASSKAKKVLESWHKEAGENATRQTILDALERCENLEAKKSLEDLWKGHNVMISYCWNTPKAQEKMKKLRDELGKRGINVWMDVDKMYGNMIDRMVEAIDGAKVVVACLSKEYEESENCRKEFEYANKKKVPIVPLKIDDYKCQKWLEFLAGNIIYRDIRSDDWMDKSFQDIVADIQEHIDGKAVRPEHPEPCHKSSPAESKHQQGSGDQTSVGRDQNKVGRDQTIVGRDQNTFGGGQTNIAGDQHNVTGKQVNINGNAGNLTF